MALRVATALVGAQYRASWNRILRTAGLGGEVATWITLGLVAIVLFLPGFVMTRIGLDLGAELATSGDIGVLGSWNGLIAVFTLGLALLGGFRATRRSPRRASDATRSAPSTCSSPSSRPHSSRCSLSSRREASPR